MMADSARAHAEVKRAYVMVVTSSFGMVEHRSFSHVHSPIRPKRIVLMKTLIWLTR
jgi:hypothetical protein